MNEQIIIRANKDFKQLLSTVANELSINNDDLPAELQSEDNVKAIKVSISEVVRANLSLERMIENAIYDMRNDLSTVFAIYKAILELHNNKLSLEQKSNIFLGHYDQWKSDKKIELDDKTLRNAVYTVLCDPNINIEIIENKIDFVERKN